MNTVDESTQPLTPEQFGELDNQQQLMILFGNLLELLENPELVTAMVGNSERLSDFFNTVSELVSKQMAALKMVTVPTVTYPKQPLIKAATDRQLVSVRPTSDNPDGKSYIGFLIGSVATGTSLSVTDNEVIIENGGHNPAMYVPELGKLVYGYESWWSTIESEDQFREITDDDISSQWYVKLFRDRQN